MSTCKFISCSASKLFLTPLRYLIHSPFFAGEKEEPLQEAWAEMEKIKEAGLAKSIGVSNYITWQLEATLKTAKVPPAINQIEFHPYLQHPDLMAFQKKHNIATAAYGPLTPVSKAKPGPLDDFAAAVAKKHAVSEGEIALRWCIDLGIVAITTSSKEQRMSDYLRCTRFELTPSEVKEITKLGEEKHYRGFWTNKFAADDRT